MFSNEFFEMFEKIIDREEDQINISGVKIIIEKMFTANAPKDAIRCSSSKLIF